MLYSPLTNRQILITRPKSQAAALSKQIQQLGATTHSFPTLTIHPLGETADLQKRLAAISVNDVVIFTSSNAVQYSIGRISTTLPTKTIIAIGPGTAQQLNHYHLDCLLPKQFNSEGILQLDLLQQIDNRHIYVITGKDARPLLKTTLQQRAAIVEEIICYRRACPQIDRAHINQIITLPLDVIISTSQQSLRNLYQIFIDHRNWLLSKQLLVISAKMVSLAKQLHFTQEPIVADNATNQAITASLLAHYCE